MPWVPLSTRSWWRAPDSIARDRLVPCSRVISSTRLQGLLAALRATESAQGRVRSERWGPRTLDLDLLVYGDRRIAEADLVVPHPGIAERGFVLAPLNDIAPALDVPGMGRVEELLRRLPDDGIAGLVAA
jgi:7,8-dihydro-6-hydroxymethylpterin-pyrophosphokinase